MRLVRLKLRPEELARLGEARYEEIRERVEKEHPGEVILIEVESGDYFIAPTLSEAFEEAKRKHPDKAFYIKRIGRRTYLKLYRGS